jgi:hypothetical protein
MCLVLVWRQTTYESWITEACQQYMHNPNRQQTYSNIQPTYVDGQCPCSRAALLLGNCIWMQTHCSLLIAQLQENGENWNHCRQVVPFQKQNMHDTRSLQSKLDSMHMHITIFNNRCNLGTGWPQGDGLVVCTEYKNSHALHNMSQGCKSLGCLWKRLGSLRKKSMWPNKYVRIPSVQVSRPFL